MESGSQPAFAELYDRHARSAYALACDIVRDRDLAQDVVQMAFLGVWRRPAGYDPARGSARSWLLAIVRHRAIDILRRAHADARRRCAAERREAPRAPIFVAIDEHLAACEQDKLLRDAVAELPGKQREAVQLAYFDDLSHSEISTRLSIPLGTVKARIRLGVERLRGTAVRAGLERSTL